MPGGMWSQLLGVTMVRREGYARPTIRKMERDELEANLRAIVCRVKLETEDSRLIIESLRSRIGALEAAADRLEVLSDELRACLSILENAAGPVGHDIPLARLGDAAFAEDRERPKGD